jgi:DNA methylase
MPLLKSIRPIYPFPARMAPEVVWDELPEAKSKTSVLDPMAGSGTTLVAARMRGHNAIGVDRDPLAVRIARAWVGNVTAGTLIQKGIGVLERAEKRFCKLSLKDAFPSGADEETREFIRYWFDDTNRLQLTALSADISCVRDSAIRELLWCAMSRLIITKKRWRFASYRCLA